MDGHAKDVDIEINVQKSGAVSPLADYGRNNVASLNEESAVVAPTDDGLLSEVTDRELELAALKAAGFVGGKVDRGTIIVTLKLAERYGLDIMRRHLVPIDGKPFITRDGLLHLAHASGRLDGIVLEEQGDDDTEWWAVVSVYRTDMSHPFRFKGRYPKSGFNKKYGPEMAVKTATAMCLRHAFDVAIGAADEMWAHPLSPSHPSAASAGAPPPLKEAKRLEDQPPADVGIEFEEFKPANDEPIPPEEAVAFEVVEELEDPYAEEERVAIQTEHEYIEPEIPTLGDVLEVPADPGLAPPCPKCDGPMTERSQRRTGHRFWGCKGYPDCKGTVDIDGRGPRRG